MSSGLNDRRTSASLFPINTIIPPNLCMLSAQSPTTHDPALQQMLLCTRLAILAVMTKIGVEGAIKPEQFVFWKIHFCPDGRPRGFPTFSIPSCCNYCPYKHGKHGCSCECMNGLIRPPLNPMNKKKADRKYLDMLIFLTVDICSYDKLPG